MDSTPNIVTMLDAVQSSADALADHVRHGADSVPSKCLQAVELRVTECNRTNANADHQETDDQSARSRPQKLKYQVFQAHSATFRIVVARLDNPDVTPCLGGVAWLEGLRPTHGQIVRRG